MVDRAALESYRSANRELSERVQAAVEGFTLSLDLSRAELARDAFLKFIPALTTQYGSVAAALAAGFYEEMRGASGESGRFRATLAKPVPAEAAAASTRYLAGHLWTPTPEAILGPLRTAVDKHVKQPGRDTVALNARREGVRWARVPSGAKTCAFCLMLASRDAVYVTRGSAGDKGQGVGDTYHGDCDCQVVRIGRNDDYPEGYLPDNYYDMYNAARENAESGSIKDIAAALRRTHPDAVKDGVHTH